MQTTLSGLAPTIIIFGIWINYKRDPDTLLQKTNVAYINICPQIQNNDKNYLDIGFRFISNCNYPTVLYCSTFAVPSRFCC